MSNINKRQRNTDNETAEVAKDTLKLLGNLVQKLTTVGEDKATTIACLEAEINSLKAEINSLKAEIDRLKAQTPASEVPTMWEMVWVNVPNGITMTNCYEEDLIVQTFRVRPGSSDSHWDNLIRKGCKGDLAEFYILNHKDEYCGFSELCFPDSSLIDPKDRKGQFAGKARDFYNHLGNLPRVYEDEPGKVYVTTLLDIGRHTNANKFKYGSYC